MPKFTANKSTSQDFFDKLNTHMQGKVIETKKGSEKTYEIKDKKFTDHQEETEKRDGVDPGNMLLDIHLPHVGDFYDMKRDRNSFRVLVFGQDPGKPEKLDESEIWDMQVNKEAVEDFNDSTRSVSSSHLSGTLYTLQLLFGMDPKNEKRKIENTEYGIYSAFALSNACLYRLRKTGCEKMYEKEIKTMLKNSLPHFKKMIEILKPQIIVLQGMHAKNIAEMAYPIHKNRTRYYEDNESAYIDEINLPHGQTLLLALPHPTQPNSRAYTDEGRGDKYLRPRISKLLKRYDEIWG